MNARTTIFNLRGEPTPFELAQMREVDALIQYQGGKWATTSREKIPAHIIAAALEAYDPTKPLKFAKKALGRSWVDKLRRRDKVRRYLRQSDCVAAMELKEAIPAICSEESHAH